MLCLTIRLLGTGTMLGLSNPDTAVPPCFVAIASSITAMLTYDATQTGIFNGAHPGDGY